MDPKYGLVACLLFAPAATAAQEPDLNAAFKDAVATFNDVGMKEALPKLDALIANRWDEMSPLGKHGATTLAMYCEMRVGSYVKVQERGAWIHEHLPEAFSSLAGMSASDVPSPEIQELRATIKLLTLKTGRGVSMVYLHNASERPVMISDVTYQVVYEYDTRSGAPTDVRVKGPLSLGQAGLVLPPGGGEVLNSTERYAKELDAADVITVIAAAVRDRLPDWIHLTKDDYTQKLQQVHMSANVTWGESELGTVPLALYDNPADPVADATAPSFALEAAYKEAFDTLVTQGLAAARPKFEPLINEHWYDLPPTAQHGAVTASMFCLLGAGRYDDAVQRGAWFHGQLPHVFSSLADFSASDTPDPEVARLRAAIKVLAIVTAKGESLLYMHNASAEPIEITNTSFDVSYGYSTATQSVGNLESAAEVAFDDALVLPSGAGAILRSRTGSGLLSTALPDCVAIIACAAKNRLPGWHHLTKGDYTQTLRRVHISGDVTWGEKRMGRVPFAWYDRPAATSDPESGAGD